MLEATEAPRVDTHGRVDEIRRLVRSGRPFVVREAESPTFRRMASSMDLQRFRSLFGDRPWRVQRSERGRLDPTTPFAAQTEEMPFSAFLDKIEHPDERIQHYVNFGFGPQLEFARELFDELAELGAELPLARYKNQRFDAFWLGGAGTITPLHFDRYARWHGILQGRKVFHLFPPDLRHHLNLEPYPLRSPIGWYSRVGAGPLDPSVFPKLKKTRPVRATVRPGDFLYLPPCWWHHVTIPDEPTISLSATFRPWITYLYWYHWRIRLARRLGGQEKFFWEIYARGRADWAPSSRDGEPTNVEKIESVQSILLAEKYYTPEQLETLRARREQVGEDPLHAAAS